MAGPKRIGPGPGLDAAALADDHREAVVARQAAAAVDGTALIQDHMVQLAAIVDVAALKHQAIGQLGALAHLDAPEQHAAFHLALDHAAVRHQAVGHLCVGQVPGGHLVLDLGVDGVLRIEQVVAHLPLEAVHVVGEIGGDGAQTAHIAVVAPAENLEGIHLAQQHVPDEIRIPVAHALLDEILQQGFFHHEHVAGGVAAGGPIRVHLQVRHPAVRIQVHAQLIELVVAVAGGHVVIHNGNIRAGADVLLDHGVEGGVKHRMAPRQDHIPLGAAADIPQHRAQGVQGALVDARVIMGHEGGQDKEPVMLAVELPFLAGAQVVHQGVVILLGDDAHVGQARIHQAGEDEVDAAIAAGKGYRGHGPGKGQVP